MRNTQPNSTGIAPERAWLADFRLLEPYRPLFLGTGRRLRIGFWFIAVLLALMFAYPYFMPLFY